MKTSAVLNRSIFLALAIGIGSAYLQPAEATPEKTFDQALAAIKANEPDELFALLPPSYQKDIDEVVAGFAGKMDSEIWEQGRRILQRVANLAKTKRALLIEMATQNKTEEVDPAEVGASIDSFSSLFGQLAGGPAADLQRLKQGNIKELLATQGRQLMQAAEKASKAAPAPNAKQNNPWKRADETKIEMVSIDGNTAAVKVTVKDESDVIQMTKVEGRWIPAEMATDWQEQMAKTKDAIAKMDYTTPEGQQKKMQAMMMLGMVDMVVGQIEQANTAQEIQNSLMGLMMMGGGMGAGAGAGAGGMGPGGAPVAPGGAMPGMPPPVE